MKSISAIPLFLAALSILAGCTSGSDRSNGTPATSLEGTWYSYNYNLETQVTFKGDHITEIVRKEPDGKVDMTLEGDFSVKASALATNDFLISVTIHRKDIGDLTSDQYVTNLGDRLVMSQYVLYPSQVFFKTRERAKAYNENEEPAEYAFRIAQGDHIGACTKKTLPDTGFQKEWLTISGSTGLVEVYDYSDSECLLDMKLNKRYFLPFDFVGATAPYQYEVSALGTNPFDPTEFLYFRSGSSLSDQFSTSVFFSSPQKIVRWWPPPHTGSLEQEWAKWSSDNGVHVATGSLGDLKRVSTRFLFKELADAKAQPAHFESNCQDEPSSGFYYSPRYMYQYYFALGCNSVEVGQGMPVNGKFNMMWKFISRLDGVYRQVEAMINYYEGPTINLAKKESDDAIFTEEWTDFLKPKRQRTRTKYKLSKSQCPGEPKVAGTEFLQVWQLDDPKGPTCRSYPKVKSAL